MHFFKNLETFLHMMQFEITCVIYDPHLTGVHNVWIYKTGCYELNPDSIRITHNHKAPLCPDKVLDVEIYQLLVYSTDYENSSSQYFPELLPLE